MTEAVGQASWSAIGADGHLVTGEMLPTFQVGKKGYRLNKDKLAEMYNNTVFSSFSLILFILTFLSSETHVK